MLSIIFFVWCFSKANSLPFSGFAVVLDSCNKLLTRAWNFKETERNEISNSMEESRMCTFARLSVVIWWAENGNVISDIWKFFSRIEFRRRCVMEILWKRKKFVEFLIYLLSVGKRIDIQIKLGEICDNCHQFSHSRIKSNSINRSALKISQDQQIIWNCSEILSSPEINNFHLILCTLEVNKVSSPKLLKLATTLNRAIFQNKPSNLFAPAKWHHL